MFLSQAKETVGKVKKWKLHVCNYSGAPNESIVQNHCWTYFSIKTVDKGLFLFPKNFSSVRIS